MKGNYDMQNWLQSEMDSGGFTVWFSKEWWSVHHGAWARCWVLQWCQCSLTLNNPPSIVNRVSIANKQFMNCVSLTMTMPIYKLFQKKKKCSFCSSLLSQGLQLYIVCNFTPEANMLINVWNFAVLITILGHRSIIFGSV